jgi:anoctamin-8
MLALAVPGAAIQIYILATGDNFPAILPFWVCYVCLWSTLQVEFWKRKTSEITTRWGCLDLLDSKDRSEVRRGF